MGMELFLFLAGCLTFPLLYFFSRQCVALILTGQSKDFYLTTSTRVVSLFQAICATCVGLFVVLTCEDIMKDKYTSVYNYAWFAVSYFYYDLGAMFFETYHHYSRETFLTILQKFLSKKWLLICHHVFLPLFGFPLIVFFRRGIGDFFVGCIYMAELSTPFLSADAILRQLGMTQSIFYKVNGILLAVTYFIGRILIFPFMYWSYSRHSKQPIWEVPFKIPLFCNLSCLGFMSLQMVWFIAIVKKVTHFLTSNKDSLSSVVKHYSVNTTEQDSKNGMVVSNGMLRVSNGKQK